MLGSTVQSERLARASQHLVRCTLCEHRCGVDRLAGGRGPCKAGGEARVFRHRVEYGEELELVPSHLFYLSGCDLRCAFCIAESNAMNPAVGTPLTGQFLGKAIAWGHQRGARNIQWVGGEPTIHIPAILEAMSYCNSVPQVVWKSDFYGTPEAFHLLDGVVDVYVADFKFGNDRCARRIAKVDHYREVVTRNLEIAARQSRLIVRHLLLPGHFECCYRPIVKWMKQHLPATDFSIRDGYLPRWQAHHYDELRGLVDGHAALAARELAERVGLSLIA